MMKRPVVRDSFPTRNWKSTDGYLILGARVWPPFWTAGFLIWYEYELMRKTELPRCAERRRK